MKRSSFSLITYLAIACLTYSGCATKPYDYTNFRSYQPRSILVLPPINESTDVRGTYSYLSTVTMPIAELGYYVYPIVEVDQFFKENGMPIAGDMHQAPIAKIRELTGADSVLYIILKQYGTKYYVINSISTVTAEAKLISTKDGSILWEGKVSAQQDSSGGSNDLIANLIGALISQVISKSFDSAHSVAAMANKQFATKGKGLLIGPYHPEWNTDKGK